MANRFMCSWVLVSACAWSAAAAAQDAVTGDQGSRLLRAMSWTETKIDGVGRATDGVYPEVGGLIPGAGIAAGPGYRRHIGTRLMIDTSAALSIRGYTQLQSTVSWPQLMDGRLVVGGQARYDDFTRVNYFGVGRDASRDDRTDYRLTYVDTDAFMTMRAGKLASISSRVGLMQRARLRSDAGVTAPNYLHADVAIEADTRDAPGYPSAGGRYRVSLSSFHDRDMGRYSFRLVEAEASQYIPLSERAVAAIHGRVDVTQTSGDQQVPFYMLPALGSGQTLRGYDDYRFRDRDAAFVTGEVRHRIAGPVDAALFYDAGSVAASAGAIGRGRLITDYGVGIRVHSTRHLLARLDIARGTEGLHAVVSFTPSLAFSKRTLAPYVP